jgi:hypothetical protein
VEQRSKEEVNASEDFHFRPPCTMCTNQNTIGMLEVVCHCYIVLICWKDFLEVCDM